MDIDPNMITGMDSQQMQTFRLSTGRFMAGEPIGSEGQYVFEKWLGEGAMGKVFLVKDTWADENDSGSLKAAKIVCEFLSKDDKAVIPLKKEFSRMCKLTHPGIVAARHLVHDQYRLYLIMDFAEGETLDAYLQKNNKPELSVVLNVAGRLAAALDYAHNDEGILHRDVKPDNVMVKIEGRVVKSVKLMDFGISVDLNRTLTTTSNMTQGAAAYRSPEGWDNTRYGKMSFASDQYSLAAVIYEMLSGYRNYPYAGEFDGELGLGFLAVNPDKHPKRIDGIADYMNDALQKALSKKPGDRFKSCKAFADALIQPPVIVDRAALQPQQNVVASPPRLTIVEKPSPQPPVVNTPLITPKEMTLTLPDNVPLELVHIHAGSFAMGSPSNESGRCNTEISHHVTLTKDFWLGRYSVTQGQWQAVMGSNPSRFKKGGRYPVECVSWEDAMGFCKEVTERERASGRLPAKYEYTLPTEAQWEYACRAGTNTPFSFGSTLNGDKANCNGNYPYGMGKGKYLECTTPVGSYAPNAWGLYDMHGNVWEWCRDWCGTYPTGSVTDPVGASSGSSRVHRGGAWNDIAGICRSAFRCSSAPAGRCNSLGFRVALVLSAPKPIVVEPPSTANPPSRFVIVEKPSPQPPVIKTPSITTPRDMTLTLPGNIPLELVHIHAGSFTMGSPKDEPGRFNDEIQHHVTLTKDFWLGKYSVTQGQWKAVMGTTLIDQANKAYPKEGNQRIGNIGDDYPMYLVNWNEAFEFCRALTECEQTAGRLPAGYKYVLPTEAQWEYACRAGTSTALYNGDIIILGESNAPTLDGIAWYGGNSSVGYEGTGWDTKDWKEKQYPGWLAGPRKVGGKKPNKWGLYDMIGNIYEWCRDWHGAYPTGSVTDPVGPPCGSYRVFRGGSWDGQARFCRSACRFYIVPTYCSENSGFRVALASVQ